MIALKKEVTENRAEIVRIRANIAQLEPWRKLDIPFCTEGTEKTAVQIGSIPGEMTETELTERIAEADPKLLFCLELQYAAPEMTCFVLFTPAEQREAAEAALRQLAFAKPMGANRSLPAEKLARLEKERAELEARNEALAEKLSSYAPFRREIEDTYDYYAIRADKYETIGTLDHSEHTFVLLGYIPEGDLEKLEALATRIATCTVEAFDADEDAPVKLKNNRFASPAQSVVTMYSAPGHGDIDPTPILAFFFYLFFGMMFSDAGYGLLLTLGCWLLLKKMKPERRMRENLRLFLYCGISTTICGLIYGSFFGDAPAAFYNAFTGGSVTMADILPWPIIDTQKQALPMMIVSVAFGLVHILVGMGCKFYIQWRDRQYLDAICDTGFWMLLLIGAAVGSAGVLGIPALGTVGIWTAIAAVIGILVTGGRKKKGFGKVIGGIASLYDITGYISDLLSYSRLLALGLTTGIMAQVFNMLSNMFGTSAWSIIPMALIFIIGHLITLGLNALGSYVHTMRLQYVEMFSKFYEGGGKEFKPFALNTKYITIQED